MMTLKASTLAAVITSNEVTAISGIGGAIVGGVLTWAGGVLNQRGQNDARRTEIRRDAYGAMLIALDQLQRLWEAPETLAIAGDRKMGSATGEAVGHIQQTYAVVRLVGSADARIRAKAALDTAWDLSNWFNTPRENRSKLGPTFDAFRDAAREFLEQAEGEVAP
jgi:hypothetical protein